MYLMSLAADPAAEFRDSHRSGAPLPPGPLLGFVIAFAAVAFISLLTYRSVQTRSIAAQRVTHTLEVLEQLESILSLMKDAETGQRGFLLTGEDPYLEPNINAKAQLPEAFRKARQLVADDPVQAQRLTALELAVNQKLAELDRIIALRRKGDVAGALAAVRTDRGQVSMDRIRTMVTTLEATERTTLAAREREWEQAELISTSVTLGGSALLLVLISAAAVLTSRDYRSREAQVWLRSGQMAFSQQIQGEQRLERLADHVLSFLASFLGARIGSLYITEGAGVFRRLAGYALASSSAGAVVRAGEGLLGQAAKENRTLRVKNVPEGYLPVTSTLGHGTPRELLISPASADGTVQAVVELGFFRSLRPEDLELMNRLSGPGSKSCSLKLSDRGRSCKPSRKSYGSATRSWKYRPALSKNRKRSWSPSRLSSNRPTHSSRNRPSSWGISATISPVLSPFSPNEPPSSSAPINIRANSWLT
jgi:CHASE3 domain sensor protein